MHRSLGHFLLEEHLHYMETAILEPSIGTSTVTRAALGDEAAFARLIDEYHEPMVRAAYVVVGDVELAREAAQNAWIIAWKRLSSLREPERVRPWLVAIRANEARQLTRRNKRQRLVEASRDPLTPDAGDPVDNIDVVDLESALRRLKPDDRGVLAMRYVAGLDSGEMAAQLGMSASGVRSRLSRLVERLREDLDGA